MRGSAACLTVTARMYIIAARPDAEQGWNIDTGARTVHAIRDVEMHEEIIIPYVGVCFDRLQGITVL